MPFHFKVHSHPHSVWDNSDVSVHLTCTSLGCGRKPKYLEETHTDLSRTCKPHTDSGLNKMTLFENVQCIHFFISVSHPMSLKIIMFSACVRNHYILLLTKKQKSSHIWIISSALEISMMYPYTYTNTHTDKTMKMGTEFTLSFLFCVSLVCFVFLNIYT